MNTYKVVNRDANKSLPEVFANFTDAFKVQQSWDQHAVIECHNAESASVEVVWERDYDNISFIENLYLNSYTDKTL